MRISLIAAFYKDIVALKLIIESLRLQDYADFELIVAEDNNDPEIANFLNSITDIDIVHTTQDDIGIRKARSQNNAIIKSTGDYLIFIDADCIPYPNFISAHAALAEKCCVLSGRRVNLGSRISQLIRRGALKPRIVSKLYMLFTPFLWLDGTTHIAQGLAFSSNGWLYHHLLSKRKKSNTNILGCNFSCFKDDIININGFDESYGETALSDDIDIQWRFQTSGLKLKSGKMVANVFHLYHKQKKVAMPEGEWTRMMKKMNERKLSGCYKATIGLSERGCK